MNNINECPICKKVSIDVFINLPHFQHFNFKTISKNEFVSKCMSCGLVFNPDAIKRIKIFKTKKYYESRQTDQLFYVEEFHRRVSRSFLQAKIINDKTFIRYFNFFSRINYYFSYIFTIHFSHFFI